MLVPLSSEKVLPGMPFVDCRMLLFVVVLVAFSILLVCEGKIFYVDDYNQFIGIKSIGKIIGYDFVLFHGSLNYGELSHFSCFHSDVPYQWIEGILFALFSVCSTSSSIPQLHPFSPNPYNVFNYPFSPVDFTSPAIIPDKLTREELLIKRCISCCKHFHFTLCQDRFLKQKFIENLDYNFPVGLSICRIDQSTDTILPNGAPSIYYDFGSGSGRAMEVPYSALILHNFTRNNELQLDNFDISMCLWMAENTIQCMEFGLYKGDGKVEMRYALGFIFYQNTFKPYEWFLHYGGKDHSFLDDYNDIGRIILATENSYFKERNPQKLTVSLNLLSKYPRFDLKMVKEDYFKYRISQLKNCWIEFIDNLLNELESLSTNIQRLEDKFISLILTHFELIMDYGDLFKRSNFPHKLDQDTIDRIQSVNCLQNNCFSYDADLNKLTFSFTNKQHPLFPFYLLACQLITQFQVEFYAPLWHKGLLKAGNGGHSDAASNDGISDLFNRAMSFNHPSDKKKRNN